MQVLVRYKVRTDDSPIETEIPIEEYFDPLDVGETYPEHGDPKHRFTHEYVGIAPSDLEWTECTRIGVMGNTTLRIDYFQDGGGWMSYLRGNHTDTTQPELIVLTLRLQCSREINLRLWRSSQQQVWELQHAFEYLISNGMSTEETNLLRLTLSDD